MEIIHFSTFQRSTLKLLVSLRTRKILALEFVLPKFAQTPSFADVGVRTFAAEFVSAAVCISKSTTQKVAPDISQLGQKHLYTQSEANVFFVVLACP